MRFLLRRAGLALVAGSVIFCCSCERHQAGELEQGEHAPGGAAQPEHAPADEDAPAPLEQAAPLPSAAATPAAFFPQNKPR